MLGLRFWSKVDKNGPPFVDKDGVDRGPCWLWTARTTKQGYGQFWLNGKARSAYPLAYTEVKGPVPNGLEIDHVCRRTGCVNPMHLEAVTHAENMRRWGGFKAPAAQRAKTHCPRGHPYSAENTRVDKRNYRYCRTCQRASGRSSYARKKQESRGVEQTPIC